MGDVPLLSSITRIHPLPLRAEQETLTFSFGTNVRVNANAATLLRPQIEPGVASDPADPLRLVAGFTDFLNGPTFFDSAPGAAISSDGGATWVEPLGGAVLPGPPGFQWGSRAEATHLAQGDSSVAWGLGDAVYFGMIGFHDNRAPPNGDCSAGGLYVYRSDDGGETWTLPASGPAIANTSTVFRDKGYIAADTRPSTSPFAGNVYMAWDDINYAGCPQVNFVRTDMVFSRSVDGGATWSTPITLAMGCLFAPVPAVAANGDVFVVWYDCNDGVRQMIRKSTDGGLSFGPAVAVASNLTPPPNPLIGSSFRVLAALPSIATDPTASHRVFVTWSSDNGASQTDVFVSWSVDGGSNWSAPFRVNDDALGNPRDQFFPWISVDTDGTVRIMWGDDRNDLTNPGGKLYDIFVAQSTNHGQSFGPNALVTDSPSNPDFDGFGGTFIGDYFGLSASGVPVWDDMQSGNHDIFGAPPLPVPVPALSTRGLALLAFLMVAFGFGTLPRNARHRSSH